MSKFIDKLTEHGYTKESVSASLKRKIKVYERLETAIATTEAELQESNLSKTKRKQMEERLVDAKEQLEQLDEEIANGIDRYKKNEATYKAAGDKLNGSRKGANPPANDPPANDPPANDPPANDPPANDPPANDPPANDPPANDPDPKDKDGKKKKSVVGWIIGGIAAIALTAIGINMYNNNS